MATLELISLRRVRQQGVPGHEPELFIDDRSVYGPGRVEDDGTVGLPPQAVVFEQAARIRLVEVNGKRTQIGNVATITDDRRDTTLTEEFLASGAHYELSYRVV